MLSRTLILLSLAVVCPSAEWLRIDDFQNQPPGPLITSGSGWSVFSGEVTRALVADDRSNPGNKALKIQHIGASDSGGHDIVWHNGAIDIPPGKVSTVFLRFLVENGADALGNTVGSEPVQSVSISLVVGGTHINAGNFMGGVRVLGKQASLFDLKNGKQKGIPISVKRSHWYRLRMVIDRTVPAEENSSRAWLAEEGSSFAPIALTGMLFKPGNNSSVTSIGIIKSRADHLTDVWMDDIYVDNTGENTTDPLIGATQSWKERMAAEAVKYRQYLSTAATWDQANDQAQHLLEAMTPAEKYSLVCGDGVMGTLGFPRLGIPPVRFSDASQGVNNGRPGDPRRERLPKTVAHPAANLLASTWDVDSAMEYGKTIGEECRSGGINVLLGPSINMIRSAECGRNFEYFSEDPFLASRITASYVKGMQATGVASNLKVLLLNEIETNRRGTNTIADERTIREIYLPPMQAGVDAGALTVMSSYNQVNGEWGGESYYLNTTLLREVLGFKGVSMTDWIGTYDGVKLAASGTDLEMPGGWALLRSREKLLGSPDIDRMAKRVLATWIKGGFLEPGWQKSDLEQHRPQWEKTARRTNLEGIVLLKNDGLLPLSNDLQGKTILVTGGNATRQELSGNGSGHVSGYNHITYAEACVTAFPKATVVPVVVPSAEQIKSADLIFVFPGFLEKPLKNRKGSAEGEGQDRTFAVPDDQLITDCVNANPHTIVAVVAGGAVAMDWADKAAAIFHVSYGGQTAAPAFMDLITGKAEPAGRLSFTIERRLEDSPAARVLEMKPDATRSWAAEDISGMARGNFFVDPKTKRLMVADVRYDEGIFMGYRWYEAKKIPVRFPFGHGLSYTKFSYSDMTVEKNGVHAIRCAITLTNTGKRPGSDVIQVYIAPPPGSTPRPPQELKGFRKVTLQPGASQKVTFDLDQEAFHYWNPISKGWTVESGAFEVRIGASSQDIRLRQMITITP